LLDRTRPEDRGVLRRFTFAALVAVLFTLFGCDSAGDADRGAGRPEAGRGGTDPGPGTANQGGVPESAKGTPNPLAGKTFYVDPANRASEQAANWERANRGSDARELRKIGDRAVAHWLTGGTDASAAVDAVVSAATKRGQLPVLVAYNIPDRDCGSFSAGGAGSPDAYRAWVRSIVTGLKQRRAVVIMEPDAVPHVVEGCGGRDAERYGLLADAVATIKSSPGAVVYLDAGHPAWVSDTRKLADALRRAGIGKADGFSLNVSNFIRTPDNLAYGDKLSDALGGRRYVVDTSRNGAGPITGVSEVDGGPTWCNPPGRKLGPEPTAATGAARVDAFLWIKRPGESDGACRPGEPPAGQWWPEYALDLAKRS
jgi:endoglucanase